MKKFLFLIVMGIGIVQLVSAQFIDVVGNGVLNEDNPTLPIPNMETVDHVIVEATAEFIDDYGVPYKIPISVSFSSGATSIAAGFNNIDINKSPYVAFDQYWNLWDWKVASLGYYTATFSKAQIVSGEITLNKNGQVKNIMTFYAYIHRTDGTVNKYSLISENRAFLFWNGIGNPMEYEFDLPVVQAERNITVTIPFSDNFETGTDLRIAVVSLVIGDQEIRLDSFNINALETNFLAKTIELENVPGEVTKIKIAIYSPIRVEGDLSKTGDSFFVGMPVLTVEEEEEDCAVCKGGITALELQYTGQKSAKKISVYKGKVDKGYLLAEFTNVMPKDILEFTGNMLYNTMGTKIIITIYDGKKCTQNTVIYTDCSKDIFAGMQFGDFLIVSGISKDGGPLCFYEKPPCSDCKGGVTALELKYTGTFAKKISVYKGKVDKKYLLKEFTNVKNNDILKIIGNNPMGSKIIITIDGSKKCTEIYTDCSKDIYAGMQFGDFLIFSGTSKDGGSLCEKPGDNGNCGECKGGVTELLLKYYGAGKGLIVKNKNGVIPATYNDLDKTISISNEGYKLGTEIYITVDSKTTALHTSCSKPIYVGMEFGSGAFKILDGKSKYGGNLCDKPYDDDKKHDCDKYSNNKHDCDKYHTIKYDCSNFNYYNKYNNHYNKSATIENTEENTKNVAEIRDFGVYPNPVLNIATVSFMPAYDGLTTVELYNSLGQKAGSLLHQSVNKDVPVSFTFSGLEFKEGLYILIMQNGEYRESAKIQISR